MSSWNEAYALCPFYKTDKQDTIVCEGITFNTNNTKHSFISIKRKTAFLEYYCNKNYTKCPHYRALETIKCKEK